MTDNAMVANFISRDPPSKNNNGRNSPCTVQSLAGFPSWAVLLSVKPPGASRSLRHARGQQPLHRPCQHWHALRQLGRYQENGKAALDERFFCPKLLAAWATCRMRIVHYCESALVILSLAGRRHRANHRNLHCLAPTSSALASSKALLRPRTARPQLLLSSEQQHSFSPGITLSPKEAFGAVASRPACDCTMFFHVNIPDELRRQPRLLSCSSFPPMSLILRSISGGAPLLLSGA